MILVKTEKGQQVLKDRSIRISPRQRSAFILFDGKRSVTDVLEAGMGIVRDDIDQLIHVGLLAPVDDSGGEGGGPQSGIRPAQAAATGDSHAAVIMSPMAQASIQASEVSGRSSQQRYKDAIPSQLGSLEVLA